MGRVIIAAFAAAFAIGLAVANTEKAS